MPCHEPVNLQQDVDVGYCIKEPKVKLSTLSTFARYWLSARTKPWKKYPVIFTSYESYDASADVVNCRQNCSDRGFTCRSREYSLLSVFSIQCITTVEYISQQILSLQTCKPSDLAGDRVWRTGHRRRAKGVWVHKTCRKCSKRLHSEGLSLTSRNERPDPEDVSSTSFH